MAVWEKDIQAFALPADTPGPPVNFRFEEVRKNSVICKWDPPLDDGGSEILNYTLEKKDNSKLEIGWSSVTSTLRGCRYLVPKLIEKKEYIFRVVAENRYGAGPPCISKPLIAKNPFGTRRKQLRLPHDEILRDEVSHSVN